MSSPRHIVPMRRQRLDRRGSGACGPMLRGGFAPRGEVFLIAPSVRRLAVGAALSVLLCAPAAAAGLLLDDDPEWKEGEYALPSPPSESALRPVQVDGVAPGRFMIDTGSLAVGGDGVIRYVLVSRARSGAESVTFEGIRCNSGERRIYASGRTDGSWVAMKNSPWVPLAVRARGEPRAALARLLFCDGPAPARDRDEVLRRLDGSADYTDPSRRGRP